MFSYMDATRQRYVKTQEHMFSALTQRVEEFRSLSPPQSAVLSGDHIDGFVLIGLSVERHLI